MTAAALFLLGFYLVPQASGLEDLPPIRTTVPASLPGSPSASAPRFRNVGYGLMGHELRLPVSPVPLEVDPISPDAGAGAGADAERPAPERDAPAAAPGARAGDRR